MPAVWNSPSVPWKEFDLIVLRSTWDYFERPAEFLEWVRRVGATTPLWNPPEMVRWNAHKSYLLDLEEAGARIVPTELLRRGTTPDLGEILRRRGWSTVVIKPAVGGNAYRLSRGSQDALADGAHAIAALLRDGDALVQPYLARARERGERSLVFFDGVFSHAVEYAAVLEENPRRPRAFRPGSEEIEEAQEILRGLGQVPLYARLDYLPDDAERWRLGELEVIEPELFFGSSPEAAHRFAEALERRLDRIA